MKIQINKYACVCINCGDVISPVDFLKYNYKCYKCAGELN